MQPGKGFLVWLAGLSVLGFLATDMYLPAFAAIQADLQTPAAAVSASLSLFLAGFAVAQLLWGPLSDRYGRKPILLLGLSIFALGSLGMLWVESAAALLTLRFVQAVGVCAATVIWQALVTDYYPSQKINRIFATIMPLVGLSPALAPLLGSWILTHFSWQAIFATLFVITLLLMLPALRLKPSVKARTEGQDKLTFATLLRSKTYRGNVLIYAACSASLFCVANRVAVYSQRDGLQPGSDWPELCSANHRFSDWRIWLPRGATKMAGLPIASVAVRAVRAERYRHLGSGPSE